ncbi:centromere-associated protein E [Lycodopsis pacificus]
MTEESAVKVCVRVRPPIEREESAASENAESVQVFWEADKKSIHQIDDGNSTKSFVFDRVFTAEETTNQLYQSFAKPLVVSSVQGYNGTIFAYGQTASGKTFTMMGSNRLHGVIPLAVEDVFHTIANCSKKEFLLRVSYMEIYNETVSDLLVDSWKRKPLEVREGINKNIYVADLTEELVTNSGQALAWIRKGEKNRHYGKTKMNERSSRSHAIFRMILESRESDTASGENADGAIIVSHLNLVDLAGSERTSQTGAEGTRFKEGCNINRSLFTLGQVIKKLTDESQKGFTNYRDSKLTRILQNSLGGNAKTVIICTITPFALDETLSTLQFASTAKKMKNDPHVTEVSDDGALLKRYRNEIVDLKRRLHEVSSDTQTTATEKKVLSQLLQEKDQLQREQEDRIRNLTNLLVTSSNLVPVRKRPKRRVTWGGKMLKLAPLSACAEGPSDLSLAESFTHPEDVDSLWEIPDEALDGRVAELELQLQTEAQQKREALEKMQTAELRAAEVELQLQLQTENQQKREALEEMQTAEPKMAELQLQLQLQTEVQQRQEANGKAEMLEFRVADLESRLEEQSHTRSETDGQMRKEFAETIQLCETLAKEKDMVVAERNYLKQELGMFIEQTERLEKEKAALSTEMEAKREMDEFESLEEEFSKEHANELQNEISELKRTVESSELQCLSLQNKLETLSEKLQKKTVFAEELQSLSGKDLVQEVAMLRRSLDDAEGLSRDTKKEWAHLRSKNIAVEEMNVTLSASSSTMEAEVNSLRVQLEKEKSRFRAMQSDLQKELSVAFDENTKLTALLDGKVPKNLIDGVALERTVAQLNQQLTASHEAGGALRAQLQELASLQTLPEKVEHLTKQLNELTDVLQRVREEKDAVLSEQRSSAEETEKLLTAERDQLQTDMRENVEMMIENQEALRTALEKNRQRKERIKQLETKLEDSADEMRAQMEALQTLTMENQEELRASQEKVRLLQDEINELSSQKAELEGRSRDGSDAEIYLQLQELQDQIQRLTEELEGVRAERDGLSSERTADAQTHSEEKEELLCRATSLSEERDQLQETLEALRREKKQLRAELEDRMETMQCELQQQLSSEPQSLKDEQDDCSALQIQQLEERLEKTQEEVSQLKSDLQENVELTMENQEELRASQEKVRLLQDEINELSSQKAELEGRSRDGSDAEIYLQLQELQDQIQRLTEELEGVRAERDGLSSERTADAQTHSEEKEELLCRATSLSEERDQLQETLEALRREKKQLRAELEDRMGTMQTEVRTLTEKLELVEAERDGLLSEKEAGGQTSTEEKEELLCRATSLSEERDRLQETLAALRREKEQLRAELEDRMETQASYKQEHLESQQQAERDEQEIKLQQTLLGDANATSGVKEAAASRLQDSAGQLQEAVGRFQTFVDNCSKCILPAPDKMRRSLSHLSTLPKPTMDAYIAACQLQLQTTRTLGSILEHLQVRAQGYMNLFELLAKNDFAVFEERCRQDLLLCRAQAPRHSLKDQDFQALWDGRLTELLDKRQLYLQKMSSVHEKLRANMASYTSELPVEKRARVRFAGQLKAAITDQSDSFSALDDILSGELDHRSAMEQGRKMTLQAIMEEHNGLYEELKLLEAQADSLLQEERSKTSTLLQALEGAPLKTELALRKDNQQLVLQLQQAEDRVKALCAHIEQLEEARVNASSRLSNHKQATQLLQTELQDSRAQVDEKDGTIQTLKSKLRQSEKNTSPSAVEMEKLQTKLFQMEVELSSASDNHKQEIQMMSTVLKVKEESMRKLKETLRRSQQEGEESILQGEDLHARLTNPRGLVIKTSILLEKNKLEEEVNQLQLKITKLESLVSSQQEEISKWKRRAIRLKGKSEAEVDKPSAPCTPTKRGLPMTSDTSTSTFFSSPKKFLVTPRKLLDSPRKLLDSPRKLLDSPKVSFADSPKSRFWGAGGSSEVLSRTCPKQFFNNSELRTIPAVLCDADVDADGKDWWPRSPKQDEMCKTQ